MTAPLTPERLDSMRDRELSYEECCDLIAEVDRLQASVDRARVRADYALRTNTVMLAAHVLNALSGDEVQP